MWVTIVIGAVLGYVIWQQGKRIQKLESLRGEGYSRTFSINFFEAVSGNKFFGKLVGIKSIEEGKEYESWSKAEQDKWHKGAGSELQRKSWLRVVYLASEDAYVAECGGKTTFTLMKNNGGLIYNDYLAGDPNSFNEQLEIFVEEKHKEIKGAYVRVLVVSLIEHPKSYFGTKNIVLCEFPFFTGDSASYLDKNMQDYIQSLGFEQKKTDADVSWNGTMENSFAIDPTIEFRKNGVRVHFVG